MCVSTGALRASWTRGVHHVRAWVVRRILQYERVHRVSYVFIFRTGLCESERLYLQCRLHWTRRGTVRGMRSGKIQRRTRKRLLR